MRIETNKVPDILMSVMKSIRDGADIFKIDVYVHMLTDLTEMECYYLATNHSNDLYENDLEFLVDTLQNALKLYEKGEEYEICQQIFTCIEKYNKILKSY